MKRTRSKMKITTMNRNNLKDPRREDFNYNTIALPFFGFFNETTLSWQLNILQRQVLSKERATAKSQVDPRMIIQKRFSKRISVKMETMSSNLITAQRFARCVRIHFLY